MSLAGLHPHDLNGLRIGKAYAVQGAADRLPREAVGVDGRQDVDRGRKRTSLHLTSGLSFPPDCILICHIACSLSRMFRSRLLGVEFDPPYFQQTLMFLLILLDNQRIPSGKPIRISPVLY